MTLLPLKEYKTVTDIEDCAKGDNPFVDLLDLTVEGISQEDHQRDIDKIFRALGGYDIILTNCHAENNKDQKHKSLYKLETKVAFKVSRLLNNFPEHVYINMNLKVTDSSISLSHVNPGEDIGPFELFIMIEVDKLSQLRLRKRKFLNISIFTNYNRIKGDIVQTKQSDEYIGLALKTMFGFLTSQPNLSSAVQPVIAVKQNKEPVSVVGDYFRKTKRPLDGYKKRIWT